VTLIFYKLFPAFTVRHCHSTFANSPLFHGAQLELRLPRAFAD
jgi:hypothetical protein